jgi:hypothetical protein
MIIRSKAARGPKAKLMDFVHDQKKVNFLDKLVEQFPPTQTITCLVPPERFWRNGRSYTKRKYEPTMNMFRASQKDLSAGAKLLWHVLQAELGHNGTTDIQGMMVKNGGPLSIEMLAKRLGYNAETLAKQLEQLLNYGAISIQNVICSSAEPFATIVDEKMFDDELAGLKDVLRKDRLKGDEDADEILKNWKKYNGKTMGKIPGIPVEITSYRTEQNGTEPKVNVTFIEASKSNAPFPSAPALRAADEKELAEKSAGSVTAPRSAAEPTIDIGSSDTSLEATGTVAASPAEPKKSHISTRAFVREHAETFRAMPRIDIRHDYRELNQWLGEQFPELQLDLGPTEHLGEAMDAGFVTFDDPGISWSDASWIAGVDCPSEQKEAA